jgi:FdhD protein
MTSPRSDCHSPGSVGVVREPQRDDARTVRRPVTPVRILDVEAGGARERPDRLVTEEPMEIRVQPPGGSPEAVAVTMRTPGHDFELAVGFCVSEGILRDRAVLSEVAYCLDEHGVQEYNVVTLRVRRRLDLGSPRSFEVNASCGLCGKQKLDDLEVTCPPVADGPVVARSALTELPERLRAAQPLFEETGGLHAAARFSADGALRAVREDVGRHNALDKLIGHAFLEGRLPLSESILMVSGRMSFEIVQKAAVAGIPVLCAVSAPSSLAVAAADRFGQTVVGFLRSDHFNVYTAPERILLDA